MKHLAIDFVRCFVVLDYTNFIHLLISTSGVSTLSTTIQSVKAQTMLYRFIIFALSLCVGLLTACKGQIRTSTKPSQEDKLGRVVTHIDNDIWAIFQDKNGHYWFGSNGSGAFFYNGDEIRQVTTEDGLLDNAIRGFQEHDNGSLFIETPSGINKYNGQIVTRLLGVEALDEYWILNPDDLWFNCNGQNLYRCDGDSLYPLQLPTQDLQAHGMSPVGVNFPNMNHSPYAVYGIDKDHAGNMWIGTVTAGAFRYDGESFLWIDDPELSTLPDGRVPGVRSMLQDKEGYYWLSNFYSKYEIDPNLPKGYQKHKAVELPEVLADNDILFFNSGLTDQDGNLWMTIYSYGVWKYDGTALHNIPIVSDKEEVLVITIYQDRQGVMWLGTRNDGVYRLEENQFEKFEPNR